MGAGVSAVHAPGLVETSAAGGLRYLLALPEGPAHRGVLAVVHGRGRAARRIAEAFAGPATAAGFALVAPRFKVERFDGYQLLRGDGVPLGAVAPFEAACRAAAEAACVDAGPVSLLGCSAGAQFAHRYAMRAPERVRRLVLLAPGWYTMPDATLAFPLGTAPSLDAPGGLGGLDAFDRVPVRVFVGAADVHRDAALRTSRHLDTTQGAHRLARAERWVRAVAASRAARAGVAAEVALELLPTTAHSTRQAIERGELVQRALAFLTAEACVERLR
jgi:alpha-beta hydrolase superfamily lysophospholipase